MQNNFLSKEVRKQLRIARRAERCLRKLKTKKGATYQQKQSWKHHIANAMRQAPTSAEQKMKDWLMANGYQFSQQTQVGPYIVDFVVGPRSKMIVEVDGSVHSSAAQKQYDRARDNYLVSHGYYVLRITNEEVLTESDRDYGPDFDFLSHCGARRAHEEAKSKG